MERGNIKFEIFRVSFAVLCLSMGTQQRHHKHTTQNGMKWFCSDVTIFRCRVSGLDI